MCRQADQEVDIYVLVHTLIHARVSDVIIGPETIYAHLYVSSLFVDGVYTDGFNSFGQYYDTHKPLNHSNTTLCVLR